MDMPGALRKVIDRHDLSDAEMQEVMTLIMAGEATPAQIGGFLVGLRMKGETIEEITAAATVMRSFAIPVQVAGNPVLDTCGTGGDGLRTFNISTAAAFVAAAAGAKVAKHGNRSVSSRSGSADVLEAAGINLELTPEQVAICIEQVGVGFLFAPRHHGATRHAVGPRREMGIRTLFNLLGPLTNPARAPHQLLGVFSNEWLIPLAEVSHRLGSSHVLVIHAEDGLDEISMGSATQVAELHHGRVTRYTVTPERFGITRTDLATIVVGSVEESLRLLQQALSNVPGPALDVVTLNAGAAIYAADLVPTLENGVARARQVIANGTAQECFDNLTRMSRGFDP
ncbi:Anthranilate phosphoribosyltransferase [Gammaproteobacteria bacterium]